MKKELRLVKKNIEESLSAHLKDIKAIVIAEGVKTSAVEQLEALFDDLSYDISVETEKLV